MKKRFLKRAFCLVVAIFMLCSFSGCELLQGVLPENVCFHIFDNGSIEKQATCSETGEKLHVCTLCGEEEIRTLPMTEHDYETEYKYDSNGHWIKCKNCVSTKDYSGHEFSNDQTNCSICSYAKLQANGEISFHFMTLGNEKAGDCVYIKAGDNDILIDGGSDYDSLDDITSYVDKYVTDNTLEYVIVTHADMDHIACFAGSTSGQSLYDYYEVKTIIDFPLTNKTTAVYKRYVSERTDEINDGNTVHYTALECYNNQNGAKREYLLNSDGSLKLEILYNYFYDHTDGDENNYSVCVMFHHGEKQFLFTGDLEKEGEEKLAEFYDFKQVELYKAGHHGSPTSSNDCLLREIQPKICVACCCAGSVQYTDNLENTFPSQAFINRIAPYTNKIYVPVTVEIEQDGTLQNGSPNYSNKGEFKMLNGNIVILSQLEEVKVECSANNTILKNTDWFKEYRETPPEWA